MGRRKKQQFNQDHIYRLLVLAEHFEKERLKIDFSKLSDFEPPLPYILTQEGVTFTCFPFLYTELPKLFPTV